ncbi:MAG: hypothetical protein CMN05_01830 [Roseibacillus sp.]|nr:hypothetical protein [Roseibacillus sp.]MBP35025.1 hypothetical protein [Roseibacillus sp.]MDP6208201.1 hypothetical protein [Roseibacillus sp.]
MTENENPVLEGKKEERFHSATIRGSAGRRHVTCTCLPRLVKHAVLAPGQAGAPDWPFCRELAE